MFWVLRIADPRRRSWGILLIRSFSLSGTSNFTCHSCIISFAWQACQTRGWPTLKVIISLFNPQVLGFGWGATPQRLQRCWSTEKSGSWWQLDQQQQCVQSVTSFPWPQPSRSFHSPRNVSSSTLMARNEQPQCTLDRCHAVCPPFSHKYNYATNEAFTLDDS
jgi:hypothetical protein